MQSESFEALVDTNENIVVSAPTAAGKTVLLEMALMKNFFDFHDYTQTRAVYLAPIKALCSEKFDEWQQKFL